MIVMIGFRLFWRQQKYWFQTENKIFSERVDKKMGKLTCA